MEVLMSRNKTQLVMGLLLAVAFLSPRAFALTPTSAAIAEETKASVAMVATDTPQERKHGWEYGLRLGTSVSYTHSRKMVGAIDGSMFQLGVILDGKLSFFHPQHEWLTTLDIKETFSKTPNISKFLKTTDSLDLASTYFYRPVVIPWIGPFARLRMLTSIFPGWDVPDSARTIVRRTADGVAIGDPQEVRAQSDIDLTGWFEPLTLKETLGAFANPLGGPAIKLQMLVGVGAQQVFTRDGFVLDDDEDTPELELRQLQDYHQVGAEFELNVSGIIQSIVTWGVVFNVFQPFYSSQDRGMEIGDLFEVKIDGKLSVKLASWLSLDYVLTVRRLPLILDEWQVQNGLLLTAGFNLL
jgi:hypothetical protein